jgi:type I restriction enzyme R subunit
MTRTGSESEFEETTIERLERLKYRHIRGDYLERDHQEVVFIETLKSHLLSRYPDLPEASLKEAIGTISRPSGVDTLRRNMEFHRLLTRGFEIYVEKPGKPTEKRHIYAINWDEPQQNTFDVVNQLPIQEGANDRRPDILIYVNGLPLVLFELKNPWRPETTVQDAFNQVQHYTSLIPKIFDYNCLTVISDGNHFEPQSEDLEDEERKGTLHGTWTSSLEWFAPWKSIDGEKIVGSSIGSMKTLIEGLFPKERLLAYIRDFVVFESANEKITKKAAKYHQFFAVKKAVEKAKTSFTAPSDRRLGVIWHTTGSGKSLSMAFLVGILRRLPELENPTIVIEVDATDLDKQLYDQFVAARGLVGPSSHAGSIDELRSLLRGDGGELIFTTMQKFQLKDEKGEVSHPILSTRQNIIIIADEAHRSQYGFLKGYARYLSEALPNAKRIGFTGTPVSLHGADTEEVFGNVIHTYDIAQAQSDGATVKIFYLPRQIKLGLAKSDVDEALEEITSTADIDDLERRKSRWAAMAQAAGARDRIDELAKDLLTHYCDRSATLSGKAMVVCMSRENCVKLYEALMALPNCPEVKIVMTGDLSKDPPAWSEAGHITSKQQRESIKERMKDPNDPLKIVIVRDMWLTGTDIPCLHTLYIDKPMKGHNIIQAISRVNRVFSDKPHGLIVDYIGVGDELREATSKYTRNGGKGDPAPEINGQARMVFFEALDAVRGLMPQGKDYTGWKKLPKVDLEDLSSEVLAKLTETDAQRDAFFHEEKRLSTALLLVKHIPDCMAHADEILYFQRIRKELQKTLPSSATPQRIEKAIKDLIDESVETHGVIDIFKLAGIEKADISILDDDFLQTFKERPHQNLRLKLLERLLNDEIQARRRKNLAQAKSFRQLLEQTLDKYHARLIDAAAVIQAMLNIRKDMEASDKRANDLGLEPDEVAFYDAVAAASGEVYSNEFLRDLVHDVVQSVKRNAKPDWTQPHRDDVKAQVRAAVKRVLRTRGVKSEHLDEFVAKIIEQAENSFRDWPMAA